MHVDGDGTKFGEGSSKSISISRNWIQVRTGSKSSSRGARAKSKSHRFRSGQEVRVSSDPLGRQPEKTIQVWLGEPSIWLEGY